MPGAVLGDAARPNREWAGAQITSACRHERSTGVRGQSSRPGCKDNPIGNSDAGSEQLPEIGRLAANLRHVGHAHVAQAPNHRGRHWVGLRGGRGDCGAHDPVDVVGGILDRCPQMVAPHAQSR